MLNSILASVSGSRFAASDILVTMAEKNQYSAKDIKQLSQREHVRHRVGMYLGSNSSEGITKGLLEIESNSTDEAMAGHGDEIILTFHADGSAEVEDHGRGIPTDKNANGDNGIYLSMQIGSGGKFNSDNYAASGGLNGIGMAATSSTSSRLDATVYRDGKKHELSFKEGIAGHFDKPNDPNAKFKENKQLKVSKDDRSAAERKKHPTGTVIRFWPDFTVFTPDSHFLREVVEFQMKSNSFLIPNVKYVLKDFRDGANEEVVYVNKNGLVDMVEDIAPRPLIVKPIHIKTEGSFSEVTTIMDGKGKMGNGEVTRNVKVEAAFGYVGDEVTMLKSYVNNIHTANGGKHEDGLWRALSRVLVNHIKQGKEAKYLKAKEDAPTMEDVRDGFIGALNVMFPEPTYTGQEKSKLATEEITPLLSKVVGDELKVWLDTKKNATQVKAMCQRIVEASRIRLAAKAQKDTQRKKSALETAASMPSKLVECGLAGKGDMGTEMIIVEGDSALGNMRAARAAQYQALLPIRGKILNAQKSTMSAILSNNEAASIIQAIGAGSSKTFNIDDMRYGRIVLAADGDVDGAHITCLLITLFYRLMPEIIKAGRLYILIPPLYEVKVKKGKNEEVTYAVDDAELAVVTGELKKKRTPYEIARNKGLGEMDPGPTWDVLLNPQNRRVKRVNWENAEGIHHMINLAMGELVEPRKLWIVENKDKRMDIAES